jgi:FMN-dependent NADH-azoreductase
MKLLHLDSSIQGNASVSRIVSAAVVERLRADIADLDVNYRDLGAAPIDHLTITALGVALGKKSRAAAIERALKQVGQIAYTRRLAQ